MGIFHFISVLFGQVKCENDRFCKVTLRFVEVSLLAFVCEVLP